MIREVAEIVYLQYYNHVQGVNAVESLKHMGESFSTYEGVVFLRFGDRCGSHFFHYFSKHSQKYVEHGGQQLFSFV